jgi:hypothetical protein
VGNLIFEKGYESETNEELFRCFDCNAILNFPIGVIPTSFYCEFCKEFHKEPSCEPKTLVKTFHILMKVLSTRSKSVKHDVLIQAMITTTQWNKNNANLFIRKMILSFVIFETVPEYYKFVNE